VINAEAINNNNSCKVSKNLVGIFIKPTRSKKDLAGKKIKK
jgi:hypothetical protein